jgi:hypothetical protein
VKPVAAAAWERYGHGRGQGSFPSSSLPLPAPSAPLPSTGVLGKKKNTETATFIEKLHMIFKTPMNKSGQKWKVKEKTNIDNIDKKNKHQNSQTLQLQQWNSLWRKFCAL